jgi:hypothetical protein
MDAIVQDFGPQMLSMFLGLVAGIGTTGIALAFTLRRSRHEALELKSIINWALINLAFLFFGAALLIGFEVRASKTAVLTELKEFLEVVLSSHTLVLVSAVTGILAAAVTAYSGYISHERIRGGRPHKPFA